MSTAAYRTPDDVIAHALQMRHQEDEWLLDQKDSVEAKIELAFAQFEQRVLRGRRNLRRVLRSR